MSETAQFLANNAGSILFVAIFVEQAGLPLPAAPVLLAAGALAASGDLSAGMAIGVTVAACVLADVIWFYLGRRAGTGLMRLLARLPFGSSLSRTEQLFARYGISAIAAGKFVPGLSFLIPALAGTFKIGVGKFLRFDALGSLVYGTFYVVLGFLFSNQVSSPVGVARTVQPGHCRHCFRLRNFSPHPQTPAPTQNGGCLSNGVL